MGEIYDGLIKGDFVVNKLALAIGVLLVSASLIGLGYSAEDSPVLVSYDTERVSFGVNVTLENKPVRALVAIRNGAYTACNKTDNETGIASFGDVPTGKYELIVIPSLSLIDLLNGSTEEEGLASGTGISGTRMNITVTEKLEGETIDVVLGPVQENSEISGKVKIDIGSLEAEGAVLILIISAFNESELYVNATTGLLSLPSEIEFNMSVPEGDYIVAVTAFALGNNTRGSSIELPK